MTKGAMHGTFVWAHKVALIHTMVAHPPADLRRMGSRPTKPIWPKMQ